MNSRQRIRTILNHKEADRVPIDLGAMRSTGISTIAYNSLQKKLGIKHLPKMYDFIQQLSYPEKEILEKFKVDVIDAGQAFLTENNDWREWILDDGSKCVIPKYLKVEVESNKDVIIKNEKGIILGKKPKSSLYIDQVYWPMGNLSEIPKEINKEILLDNIWLKVPAPPWYLDIKNRIDYKTFKEKIKKFYQKTDYAIMLSMGCKLFETGVALRRMDGFLVDIMIDKKGTERLLDVLIESNLEILDIVLKEVSMYIDILEFGDDLGTQQGSFFSPELFKSIFKPRYKKMWDFIHEKSDCKVFLHSDGSLYEFIPDLIDAGLDILNPVQTNAANMEPKKLKKEFGKDLTFWGGGCDTNDILPHKSPKEIREDVKKRIEIFMPGGGFVFNQIHNILADVPPENIIAMLEAAYKYGKY
jgi:uroporphyrinogen decarboxylase